MNHFEALDIAEDCAARLCLKDAWGEPLEPIVSMGVLAKHFDQDWEEMLKAFETGMLTPEGYVTSVKRFVDEYRRHLVRIRVERALTKRVS